MEEGCLSLPGVHEKVARSAKVRVKYLDEDLKEHEETVEGLLHVLCSMSVNTWKVCIHR